MFLTKVKGDASLQLGEIPRIVLDEPVLSGEPFRYSDIPKADALASPFSYSLASVRI